MLLPAKPFKWAVLSALLLLGIWYLGNELPYVVSKERGDEPLFRTAALLIHGLLASPLLLMPPLQFSRRFRLRWPAWHRRVGKLYLTFSIGAAFIAIYLGLTFESTGRRVPIVIFAILWLYFSTAAWLCATRRAFPAHEKFVARSYAVALGFVLVRVMGDAQSVLFAFLPSEEISGVTREWLCFVLPLLVVELGYSWWPSLPAARAKAVTT